MTLFALSVEKRLKTQYYYRGKKLKIVAYVALALLTLQGIYVLNFVAAAICLYLMWVIHSLYKENGWDRTPVLKTPLPKGYIAQKITDIAMYTLAAIFIVGLLCLMGWIYRNGHVCSSYEGILGRC